MSSIRERSILCLVDLPKKLTSRRNLQAHFSKFGEVKKVSVNKDLRSAMIQFSTHFEAQSAKSQGNIYEEKPLNIFWSDSTTLDPRARDKHEYTAVEPDPLWQDDDKECFGVESVHQSNTLDDRKQSAKDMIKQHLKLPTIKKRLGSKIGEVTKFEASPKSPTKLSKVASKTLVSLKKSILNQGNKRKLVRKEEESSHRSVISKQKKVSVLQDEASKSIPLANYEQTDLKLKLSLLDERDKLIRKETVLDSNIKTVGIMKGTCPDMCPERERILRQVGHAVATYEMLPGTNEMDENKAVKEYIRSSADQEVPLPHDLRPGPVLSMTMSYLVTNIINKIDNPDENKAVWYSFCWNRLRSIRKDIILQQLCDMETVKIVEQCARFHICCYDHMWGAEVSGFDDKINTQNLIDCLQTLRHMYEDLTKHNVVCPNESEFYSYLILLKLKSGDVMWEYQQYSLEIQLSPHVQFAIETYMAFKNNMYSKYFSLVKKASYLTACLMQRYFDEVRTQALKTMLKAYCLPGKAVGLSSSFIVSCLKFDSQKNALRFCEREEVEVKADCDRTEQDSYVSTSSFLIREKRLPIANAVVGETNPLPVYVSREVHSSFDEFGKLKNPLQASCDEDTTDFPEDDLFFEEDKTGVNISEVEVEQPVFRFSVSPTKMPENLFGKCVFSDPSQPFGMVTKNEVAGYTDEKQDPSKALFSSINNFDKRTVVSTEMEQDVDQEMTYEFSETHQDTVMVTGAEQKPSLPKILQPNLQNPFYFVKNEENTAPTFLKGYNPLQSAQNVKTTKDSSAGNFKFSIAISNNEESTKPLNKEPLHSINKQDLYFSANQANTGFVKSEIIQQQYSVENKKDTNSDNKDINVHFTHDEPKSAYSGVDIKQASIEEEDVASMREALLLEKLQKEKAKEERLKMEKIKKIEMEQMRRKIEEQKVLQALKKNLSERLKTINARKYARQWKKKVEKLKQSRADFPMLVQLSVTNHLSLWGTTNSIPTHNIFQRAKDKITFTRVISHLLQSGITESCRFIGSDLAESLAKHAVKTMKKGINRPIYWKLAFSVPWRSRSCSELSVFNQLMRRWCRQAFYKREGTDLGSVECFMTSLEIPVNISVHFSDDAQSSHNLQAMDALVFVVLNESETEKLCLQRLRNLLTSKNKSGEFSVAVMNVGGNKFERVLKMELEELHEQNLIEHWKINSWSSPKSINESLEYLAEHINVISHISASSLEFLVKQACEEFFDALNSGQHSSGGLMDAVKSPNNIIYLYNTHLSKIEDLLLSKKLEKYFNFAEEFKTHIPLNESGGPELLCGKKYNELYKTQISKKINSLKLAEFTTWPPKSANRLVKMLKSYCSQVHDVSVFPQIFRMLDLPDDSDLQKHLEQVSWLDIVETWAQCSIRHSFSSREKSKRLFVIFNKNDLQQTINRQWWLKLPVCLSQ